MCGSKPCSGLFAEALKQPGAETYTTKNWDKNPWTAAGRKNPKSDRCNKRIQYTANERKQFRKESFI